MKNNTSIKVGPLSLMHLYQLSLNHQQKQLRKLQFIFFKNIIASLEDIFQNFLGRSNPYCVVASENNKIKGYIVIEPNNKRGTCWSISQPVMLSEPKYNSTREVKFQLHKLALESMKSKNINWIIKYPNYCTEELSIIRELGFQPQKQLKVWSVNTTNNESLDFKQDNRLKHFSWQPINNRNAFLLWKLEKSQESVVFREVIDRQLGDLLKTQDSLSGILISQGALKEIAVAGLIKQRDILGSPTAEIVRDIAWDSRLEEDLPCLLKKLFKDNKDLLLESNSEDNQLSDLLIKTGLKISLEIIVLCKTNLVRKETKTKLSPYRTLESILGKIQPDNPPLPTPMKVAK